jgi:hypothetical protein
MMIRKLWKRYQAQREYKKWRRELEHDRRMYLANLQAQFDASLITRTVFEVKAEQWADRVS